MIYILFGLILGAVSGLLVGALILAVIDTCSVDDGRAFGGDDE